MALTTQRKNIPLPMAVRLAHHPGSRNLGAGAGLVTFWLFRADKIGGAEFWGTGSGDGPRGISAARPPRPLEEGLGSPPGGTESRKPDGAGPGPAGVVRIP